MTQEPPRDDREARPAIYAVLAAFGLGAAATLPFGWVVKGLIGLAGVALGIVVGMTRRRPEDRVIWGLFAFIAVTWGTWLLTLPMQEWGR